MTLAELLAEAAVSLPPQKPRNTQCSKFTPVLFTLQKNGFNSEQMAQWLIDRKKVEPEKLDSCRRSISQLLKKHAPKAPVIPTQATL